MSKFRFEIYPAKDYDIRLCGIPYSEQPKKPVTLSEWANRTGADIVYPLAMYNMSRGTDQYGPVYGRTIQYVRADCGDVGYGGTEYVLGLGGKAPEQMKQLNSAGTNRFACAGYKVAIVSGTIVPGLDANTRRSRNVNGITEAGDYFHMVTEKNTTEAECADFLKDQRVRFALMQDGGGTTGKWTDGKLVFAPEKEGTNGRPTCSVIAIKRKKTEGGKETMMVTCTKKCGTYDVSGKVESGRYIDKGDVCVIETTVAPGLLIPVEYPVKGGTRKAYTKNLENFTNG